MTPSQLKHAHESANPKSFFFTRNNMKFAGDTMRNYRVASAPETFRTWSGDMVTCHVLQRIRPVGNGLQSSAYFCTETFRHIHKPADPAESEARHIWNNWRLDQRQNYKAWTFGARLELPELHPLAADIAVSVDARLLEMSRRECAA